MPTRPERPPRMATHGVTTVPASFEAPLRYGIVEATPAITCPTFVAASIR